MRMTSAFQFHTGSIKRKIIVASGLDEIGFNSILVRLKANNQHRTAFVIDVFQFHTGSIKSLS